MKEQEKIVTNSFVANSYNNWLDDMTAIYISNKENPVALNQFNASYIDGVLRDMPTKESENTRKSLMFIGNQYEKAAKDSFDERQETEAINVSKAASSKSRTMAIDSIKNNEPTEIQTVKMGEHLNVLRQNRDAGIISQEFYNKEVASFGREVELNNLVNVLTDEGVSDRFKADFLKGYITGKSDDKDFNETTKTSDRIAAAREALSISSDVYLFETKRERERSEARAALFDSEWARSAKYIATKGIDNPDIITEQQQRLYQFAQTEEDFKRVKALNTISLPSTTHPLTMARINREKAEGIWNEDRYMYYLRENKLDATEAATLGNELSMPFETNKKVIGTVIDRARADLIKDENQKLYFYDFMSRLQANEKLSSQVLTPQEAIAEATKELNETKKIAPVSQIAQAETEKRLKDVGVSPDEYIQLQTSANENARKTLKKENPTTEDMKPFIKASLTTNYDTRKRNNLVKGIELPNGSMVTDKSLIIETQLAIIMKMMQEQEQMRK